MAEGLQGIVDFVGYPVGQGVAVAAPGTPFAGYHGIVDFTGVPTGLSVGGAVTHGRNVAAGKQMVRLLLDMAQQQRKLPVLQNRRRTRNMLLRDTLQLWESHLEVREQQELEVAAYSVLLAEV